MKAAKVPQSKASVLGPDFLFHANNFSHLTQME